MATGASKGACSLDQGTWTPGWTPGAYQLAEMLQWKPPANPVLSLCSIVRRTSSLHFNRIVKIQRRSAMQEQWSQQRLGVMSFRAKRRQEKGMRLESGAQPPENRRAAGGPLHDRTPDQQPRVLQVLSQLKRTRGPPDEEKT